MKLAVHKYQNEDDYWRIREFLRDVFLLNGRRDLSWPVTRLDYWRWHLVENCQVCDSIEDVIFIWETSDGQIAAVLNSDVGKDANLLIHPGFRTLELEEDMLDVAEEHLAFSTTDGRRKLFVDAYAHDNLRQDILTRRGYTRHTWPEYQWRRVLDVPVEDVPVPAGYTIRALGDVDELPARSWASWRAFHPDEPDEAYEGWEWYHNIQRMPLYRRDLDIVAVVPGGEIAAFCTLWYDDATRTGHFLPVGATPEHQQRGLSRAVLCEAMCRLQSMGGTLAIAHGYEEPANALYASALSSEYELSESWVKEWSIR